MKTRSFVPSFIVSSLSIFAILSCDQTPASSVDEVRTEHNSSIIASLNIGSYGSVEFFETEPGCLVTSATVSSMDALAPYKGLNPVEFYEALSGSDAPVCLVAAYQRAKDAAKTQSNEVPPPDFKNDELITDATADELAKTKMEFNEFVSAYCMGMGIVDFGTCIGDATGSSSYQVWAAEMYNYVHAKQGSLTFKTQWWNSSTNQWVTMNNQTVYQGQTKSYSFVGITRYRRISVSNATSDIYHYAFMGYEVAQ